MKRNLSLLKLIALLVVLPIFVWCMALSRTFDLWQDWRADTVSKSVSELK